MYLDVKVRLPNKFWSGRHLWHPNACGFRATWIIILLKVFVIKWVVLHMAMSTEGEFRHQKEWLELLLNLTTKITSSLDLREVLRAIAANIREVIHADAVVVSLPDAASITGPDGTRLYHKKIVGTVERYPDENAARRSVVGLVSEINADSNSPNSSAMAVAQLCDHSNNASCRRKILGGVTQRRKSTSPT
jgi:hypothetical protein